MAPNSYCMYENFIEIENIPSRFFFNSLGFVSRGTPKTELRNPKKATWIFLCILILHPVEDQTNQIGGFW